MLPDASLDSPTLRAKYRQFQDWLRAVEDGPWTADTLQRGEDAISQLAPRDQWRGYLELADVAKRQVRPWVFVKREASPCEVDVLVAFVCIICVDLFVRLSVPRIYVRSKR